MEPPNLNALPGLETALEKVAAAAGPSLGDSTEAVGPDSRGGPQAAVSGRRSSGSQGESLRQSVQSRPGPNGSLSLMIMMITGIPGAGRRLSHSLEHHGSGGRGPAASTG